LICGVQHSAIGGQLSAFSFLAKDNKLTADRWPFLKSQIKNLESKIHLP
jgi:hypothetical protein